MSTEPKDLVEKKQLSPDFINADAAFKRAAKRARKRARQAGIGVVIMRDGKMVEEMRNDEDQ